ncbi:MAG: hypothetical protein QM582_14500 [Micropruina sp.]|uniref:phage holin n=1 Tax=Micropruina sp. TaxID=2737536 RepID=UPI0039E2A30D
MSGPSPQVRQRCYLILTAALPILVAYGVLADTDVSMWLALGAAILGTGGFAVAAVHTPSGRHRKDD